MLPSLPKGFDPDPVFEGNVDEQPQRHHILSFVSGAMTRAVSPVGDAWSINIGNKSLYSIRIYGQTKAWFINVEESDAMLFLLDGRRPKSGQEVGVG